MIESYHFVCGEKCMNCGKIHKVAWIAPHKLWKKISNDTDNLTVCVDCFSQLCAFHGIDLVWTCNER